MAIMKWPFRPPGICTKVAIGWFVIMTLGLGEFVWAKSKVVDKRVAIMKSKQRIKDAHIADSEKRKREHFGTA
ncbi:hypothetical protein ScPMuIL_017073 [Solemya velum]